MLDTLRVLVDDQTVNHFLACEDDVIFTELDFIKALNSNMWFTITTSNLLALDFAQNNFKKVILVHFDEKSNKYISEEVWPDDSKWNKNGKEIRKEHIFRKLIMPYILSLKD